MAASELGLYMGTYRGIMSSGGSPSGYGEMELTISPQRIVIQIARGDRIETLNRYWGEFSPLSAKEVAKQFRPGSKYPPRVTAFRSRLNRWPMTMMFLREPDTALREFALTLRHDTFDTMLYGPRQVLEGAFNAMVSVVEKQYGKDKLPRLQYGGWMVPQSASGVSPSDVKEAIAALQRKDCARALALSRPAAEAGDAQAQVVLAALNQLGCGVPSNVTEAVLWYNKAAKQDNIEAQLNLAQLYDASARNEKNPAQAKMYQTAAMDYYQMAADQGVVEAQHNLAALKVQAKDPVAAAVWFQLAAEQGFPASQHSIAVMLRKGDGVPKDLVRAYMWFWLVGKRVTGSAKAIEELNHSMPPAQIAKAKRLAAAFKPRKNP